MFEKTMQEPAISWMMLPTQLVVGLRRFAQKLRVEYVECLILFSDDGG